jgi:2-polyprenyl-3-methyl-5-hydroxy-6-metoxy-1,4-benzoquinol methylase
MQEAEKNKYEEMWQCSEYRLASPGFFSAQAFLNFFRDGVQIGDTIIDFGCGTGRAGSVFLLRGLSVQMVDIVSNCLDEHIANLMHFCSDKFEFIEACLWDLPKTLAASDWIYCCDVLEHLPEEFVDLALAQMSERTKKGGFFQIFLQEEHFGDLIGKQLHLTLHTKEWWIDKISNYWKIEGFGPEIPDIRFSVYLRSMRND